jgi:peptidoglycan/LPS O-acetylase OafA/YrhL
MKYRSEIDGLRALAVVPVIIFHGGFEVFSGGYVGVDVFFVISGYLITSIIISEMSERKFSLLNFYERRARRILPALFLVLAACIPFAWMWLIPHHMQEFSQSLVAVSTFSSNIFFWTKSGYFGTAAELTPLLHTWSLAVEEQFYILFPLFLMFAWRLGTRWVLAMLAIIFVLSIGISHWGAYAHPTITFYMLPTRSWELLLGSFAGFYFNKNTRVPVRDATENALSAVGLILIVYSIFTFDKTTPFPSLYTLLPTVGALLIILFARERTIAHSILSSKLFVGIGLISYSAYLWHQPLFAFERHRSLAEPSSVLMAGLGAVSILLAYLSWRFVEQPFRQKQKIKRNLVFGAMSVVAALYVSFGLVGHFEQGLDDWAGRVTVKRQGDIGQLGFHKLIAEKYSLCTPKIFSDTALKWEGYIRCMQSINDKKINIAIIGDSHAEHLFVGLAEALPKKNVVFYIKDANPFVSTPDFKDIFRSVRENKDISVVVLGAHWVNRILPLLADGKLEDELDETLGYLTASGKKVVLVGDVPLFWMDPGRCIYTLRWLPDIECVTDTSHVVEYENQYTATLIKAGERPNVEFIQLRNLLCNQKRCNMMRGDKILYRDNNHLNVSGSIYVGSKLVEQSAFLKSLD